MPESTLTQLFDEFELLIDEGDANKAALVLDDILALENELRDCGEVLEFA